MVGPRLAVAQLPPALAAIPPAACACMEVVEDKLEPFFGPVLECADLALGAWLSLGAYESQQAGQPAWCKMRTYRPRGARVRASLGGK
eukprot:227008-Pyramimonas_sp.AAC.1